MLSTKYLRVISQNRDDIVADLFVGDILSGLRSCESFSLSDEEIVQSKVTSVDKASTLLDILSEKDDACFEHFIEILGITYQHLAEGLTADIENKRVRRLSHTELGELLIKGGVPDNTEDFIPRKNKEDEIIKILKSATSKPILVHGVIGCGKSSMVAHVLHSDGIFPDRYLRVCWMTIGNIKDIKEVITKLIILSSKLDSKDRELLPEIPDLYKDRITEKLRKHNILLILDDIWNSEIMKYFLFPTKYIVTSRSSNLFSKDQAILVMIPSQFSKSECDMFLDNYILDTSDNLRNVITEKSHRKPLTLSMIKNLLKSNKDYFNAINNITSKDLGMNEIIKRNIAILTPEMHKRYAMLSILNEDDGVSHNSLSIYWDINESTALEYVTTFCNNHLMTKIWSAEYNCNLYGLHDFLWEFLKSEYKENIGGYKRIFIDNYKRKFPNWLKFDHRDPYFFTQCGRILNDDLDALNSLFTDFTFLSSKIVISGISDLLFDYDNYRPSSKSELWDEFNRFFMRHNHRFVQLPNTDFKIQIKKIFSTIIQLAFCEGSCSEIYKKALSTMNLAMRNDFWMWDNVESSMKVWEVSHVDVIKLMDINYCGIILTSESGRLSLYDFISGNCLFNYQILTEECILCKFIKNDTLEFLVVGKSGQLKRFDILKLLGPRPKVIERIEDDDFDPSDDNQNNTNFKIDFGALRQKFRHILVPEFLKTCQNEFKLNNVYITGSFDDEKLVVVSEGPDVNTKIEIYVDEDFHLANDFYVPYKVEKILHVTKGRDLKIYILEKSGSKLCVMDDLGDELDLYRIDNEVIIDFIVCNKEVCDEEVYQAAKNNIYKNKEVGPLFSTMNDVSIAKISMCNHTGLMALCLTNKSIQIWSLSDRMLIYSLKGFDFTDMRFEQGGKQLITTEESNASKWSIVNRNNETNNRNYRSQFYMYYSGSAVTWIVQTYTNILEFRTHNNGDYSGKFIDTTSKVTCLSIDGDYAFIGFKSSHVQVYNLVSFTCDLIIDSVNNVSNLDLFDCDVHYWNLVVHYDVNKIKIFSISKADYSCTIIKEQTLGKITKLKIFRVTSNLIIGYFLDNECVLNHVTKEKGLEVYYKNSVRTGYNIIDFDINDLGSMLCVATAKGTLQVWSIQSNLTWIYPTEPKYIVIRLCKFRPDLQNPWQVVASVSDTGEVCLFYFKDSENRYNIIIEDFPQNSIGMYSTIKWTVDGTFLIFGDNEVKKWKVPLDPMSKIEVKHPLTKLYTYSGGIRCINIDNSYICTIDEMGLFYIFRKIEIV